MGLPLSSLQEVAELLQEGREMGLLPARQREEEAEVGVRVEAAEEAWLSDPLLHLGPTDISSTSSTSVREREMEGRRALLLDIT